MKKILLIPDSFKGTMSSMEICSIMEESIHHHYPEAEVVSIPVADGGEGSVDAFLEALGGEKVSVKAQDPYGREINSFYGILPDGTAVIEMAAAAGLPLVGKNRRAEKTTTYGVGQLIEDALRNKCKKLIVGLGGSATNEGGCGAAAALGVRFINSKNESFVPVGETLKDIAAIDASGINPLLREVPIVTMCDIDNPLCGPQKGADEGCIKMLDAGLYHMSEIIKRDLDKDVLNLPGSGAAGGMGGGMAAFFNSTLQPGIETVLDTVHFNNLLEGADLIISGEGKIDTQSLRGKVVIGVARRAKKSSVPLIAVVGDIGSDIQKAYEEGVTGIFSINRVALPYEQIKLRAKDDLRLTIDNIMYFMKHMR